MRNALFCKRIAILIGSLALAEGGPIPVDATLEHIFTVASRGGEKMPPFGEAYTPEQLKSVAAYVRDEVLP